MGAVVTAPSRRPAVLLKGGGQEQADALAFKNMLGIIGFELPRETACAA